LQIPRKKAKLRKRKTLRIKGSKSLLRSSKIGKNISDLLMNPEVSYFLNVPHQNFAYRTGEGKLNEMLSLSLSPF